MNRVGDIIGINNNFEYLGLVDRYSYLANAKETSGRIGEYKCLYCGHSFIEKERSVYQWAHCGCLGVRTYKRLLAVLAKSMHRKLCIDFVKILLSTYFFQVGNVCRFFGLKKYPYTNTKHP